MKVNHLELHFARDGTTEARLWIECHTTRDVDVLEAWARFARRAMKEWGDIDAKASRAAKAAAGKNEDRQPREIQDRPQGEVGPNRLRSIPSASTA